MLADDVRHRRSVNPPASIEDHGSEEASVVLTGVNARVVGAPLEAGEGSLGAVWLVAE